MTFWHYIIIGVIIQVVICVERLIRLQVVRQVYKEELTNPCFWLILLIYSMINVTMWPVAIYTEIRLIQYGA